MRQISFPILKNYKPEFGGELLLGKRKAKRPLSTTTPTHLIFRADELKVFLPGNMKQEKLLSQLAERFHIKIYQKSFNWTHLHLLVTLPSREAYNSFVRLFTAGIVSLYEERNGKNQKLFKLRPFTRVVSWGRDFKRVRNYHEKNNRESWGMTEEEMAFVKASLSPPNPG